MGDFPQCGIEKVVPGREPQGSHPMFNNCSHIGVDEFERAHAKRDEQSGFKEFKDCYQPYQGVIGRFHEEPLWQVGHLYEPEPHNNWGGTFALIEVYLQLVDVDQRLKIVRADVAHLPQGPELLTPK